MSFRTGLFIKAVREKKPEKYKTPTHPNFSQNLDENLKIIWFGLTQTQNEPEIFKITFLKHFALEV